MEKEKKKNLDNLKVANSYFYFFFLLISLFFRSYFSICIKYNVNTLFSIAVNNIRYYNLLFWNIPLKLEPLNRWIKYFSLFILLSYFLSKFFLVISDYLKNKVKNEFEKNITNLCHLDCRKEWINTFSSKIIESFFTFYFFVIDFIIETWFIVKTNRRRDIKKDMLLKIFIVSVFSIFFLKLIDYLNLFISKNKKSQDKNSILYYINKNNEKIKSLDFPHFIFSTYFIFLSNGSHKSEVINIILISMNLSTFFIKFKNIIKNFPEAKDTFEIFKKNNHILSLRKCTQVVKGVSFEN